MCCSAFVAGLVLCDIMLNSSARTLPLPDIVVGKDDHLKLVDLVAAATGDTAAVGQMLLAELERAQIVAQADVPDDRVRVGSKVSYITSEGFGRSFQLVFPDDTDLAGGKVSILTPMGAALIGLRVGQTIPWKMSDKRELALTIRAVSQDG